MMSLQPTQVIILCITNSQKIQTHSKAYYTKDFIFDMRQSRRKSQTNPFSIIYIYAIELNFLATLKLFTDGRLFHIIHINMNPTKNF
eukprot:UN10203